MRMPEADLISIISAFGYTTTSSRFRSPKTSNLIVSSDVFVM